MTFLTKLCRKCKGKGFRYVRDYFDPSEVVPEDCEECHGTGEVSDTFLDGALECKVCHLVYGDNHGRKR